MIHLFKVNGVIVAPEPNLSIRRTAAALIFAPSLSISPLYSNLKDGLMAKQRMPARRNEREELVAYLHGIDPNGKIVHVLVHKRGENVRFSGSIGDHRVAPANAGDLTKWVREAEAALNLEDVIGVLRGEMNIPQTLAKMEVLHAKAEEKKKTIAAPA